MKGFVTRIAPSPTGDMHLGTARTGYFNWLIARASGGSFFLRIDDTDLERNKEEHVQVILDTMDWLGLKPDIVFRQSEQNSIHKATLELLVQAGHTVTLDNGAVALKCPDNLPDHFFDEVAGNIRITDTNREQIHERLILARGGDKLGQVTYQFASVVDDYFMGVNYICRGVDHISNTPKQLAIWLAIAAAMSAYNPTVEGKPWPKVAHLGLIFKDGKKLSKRDGAASMLHYKEQGYNPDAVLNFMLRLGWSPRGGDDVKYNIIGRELATEVFLEIGQMKNANVGFDAKKLEWYNGVYNGTIKPKK